MFFPQKSTAFPDKLISYYWLELYRMDISSWKKSWNSKDLPFAEQKQIFRVSSLSGGSQQEDKGWRITSAASMISKLYLRSN